MVFEEPRGSKEALYKRENCEKLLRYFLFRILIKNLSFSFSFSLLIITPVVKILLGGLYTYNQYKYSIYKSVKGEKKNVFQQVSFKNEKRNTFTLNKATIFFLSAFNTSVVWRLAWKRVVGPALKSLGIPTHDFFLK